MATTASPIDSFTQSQPGGLTRWRYTLSNALIITRREVRDSFRDWRIIAPIIILTLVFPSLAQFIAGRFSNFVADYGADIANRIARSLVVPAHREGGQETLIRSLRHRSGREQHREGSVETPCPGDCQNRKRTNTLKSLMSRSSAAVSTDTLSSVSTPAQSTSMVVV